MHSYISGKLHVFSSVALSSAIYFYTAYVSAFPSDFPAPCDLGLRLSSFPDHLFSHYHARTRRFFRRNCSFGGFIRFGTTLRQFFLSCAVQFTVPGIGVLEINEVLSLGLIPLSCIVIHTPANQVTILHLPRESSVFSVCSLVVRELFSMHLGYSTY